MLGFVAAGMLRGDHPQTTVEQLVAYTGVDPHPLVVDVRTPEEFQADHIRGAVNRPIDSLRSVSDDLPRDRPIIAYCEVGQRGYLATRILMQRGFDATNLNGGFRTYQAYRATGAILAEPSGAEAVSANGNQKRKCACGKQCKS